MVPLVAAVPFALLGVQLLRIARSSGATPDRLLAGFFLGLAAGIPPRMMGIDLAIRSGVSWTGFWLSTVASVFIGTALVCLAAFAWKVFRPGDAWAERVVIGFAAALCAALLASTWSLEASHGAALPAICFNGLGAAALVWSFVECVRYYRMMRRRQLLGMGDPLVANRFLLWSLWTGAIGLQATLMFALRIAILSSGAQELLVAGADPGGPWIALIHAGKGLLAIVAPVAVVSVWLSFSPPAAYQRWLVSSPA